MPTGGRHRAWLTLSLTDPGREHQVSASAGDQVNTDSPRGTMLPESRPQRSGDPAARRRWSEASGPAQGLGAVLPIHPGSGLSVLLWVLSQVDQALGDMGRPAATGVPSAQGTWQVHSAVSQAPGALSVPPAARPDLRAPGPSSTLLPEAQPSAGKAAPQLRSRHAGFPSPHPAMAWHVREPGVRVPGRDHSQGSGFGH